MSARVTRERGMSTILHIRCRWCGFPTGRGRFGFASPHCSKAGGDDAVEQPGHHPTQRHHHYQHQCTCGTNDRPASHSSNPSHHDATRSIPTTLMRLLVCPASHLSGTDHGEMASIVHLPPTQPNRTPFPPIGDYGFLSDCQTSCLVARDGSVEWLCVPRPDSPSVFGSLLDRSAGHFRIGPHDRTVPAARRYLPGGIVLETTWQTETGWITVRDALVMGPWYDLHQRSATQRRTPSDWEAEHILLRTVRCVNGTVELNMSCEPAFDYHRGGTRWEYTGKVYEEATAVCADAPDEHPRLRLTSNMRLGIEGREARARTRMRKGDNVFVALSWGEPAPPHTFDEAAAKMLTTQDYWREWVTTGRFPDHPWRTYLERSALTLKGLTYSPTGALLAAATTSLPETPGGERNWDYRYAWVRDSTFALWGLYTLGLDREADDFFSSILDVSQGADGNGHHPLQVMYGVGGEHVLEESTLDHLCGYNNANLSASATTRTGNGSTTCGEPYSIRCICT